MQRPAARRVKYRPLRRRRNPHSPRAVVRPHLARWRRVAIAVVAFSLAAGAAVWAYDAGRRLAHGADFAAQNAVLRAELAEVSGERDRLRAGGDTAQAQLEMARAAQERLAQQLKESEAEVAQLKEDLAFFETLLPAAGNTAGVHVRSFRVGFHEADPGRMQYRLLVMQGGSKAFAELPEFRGELQFTVSLVRDGKPVTLTLPQPGERTLPALRLQHYQRVEGDLGIPQGAQVRAVVVRVLQNGQTRATQTATP